MWTLATTDFKMRYQGSVLGYVWAILKPLFIFAILNYVFSSIFNPRSVGNEYYSLKLLIGIILFNFFFEGTIAGMNSLVGKGQLVTKIYVPRWTIIIASTLNAAFIFLMNGVVILAFFAWQHYVPSIGAVLLFVFYCMLLYGLIVAFSLLTAPLFVLFRDLMMIWEVVGQALFYATPIIYPLTMMPERVQKILLLSPIAFLIYHIKEGIFVRHYPTLLQHLTIVSVVVIAIAFGTFVYSRLAKQIAEKM